MSNNYKIVGENIVLVIVSLLTRHDNV
jgi:hypothetical protein